VSPAPLLWVPWAGVDVVADPVRAAPTALTTSGAGGRDVSL
jgi:hypothetical protein